MRMLWHVWQWVQRRDTGKLGQHIIWIDRNRVRFTFIMIGKEIEPGRFYLTRLEDLKYRAREEKRPALMLDEPIADARDQYRELFKRWKYGEVLAPARLYLTEQINKKMKKLAGNLSLRLFMDEKEELRGFIVPYSLLAAMWLGLYQAITGERRVRQCEICGEYMDVTENRKTKRMHDRCSQRVRTARSRRKKRQERQDSR